MTMDVASCSRPFRHWLVRGLVPEAVLAAARPSDLSGWVRYENELEQKWATRGGRNGLPIGALPLFDALVSWPCVAFLRHLTGITDLDADPDLWGAGLHVSRTGDRLAPHLDYDACPHRPGWRRRLNLVLFLCEAWDVAWGGEFQLCDPAGKVLKSVPPEPGLAILWEASDLSYHAAAPVAGPATRPTAACYYLSPIPAPATRTRALFVPQRS